MTHINYPKLPNGEYVIISDLRTCRVCDTTYPDTLDNFTPTPSGNRSNQCRPCGIKRTREWRKANPERARKQDRSKMLQKKYGISLEEYDAMLEAQQHRCAICGEKETVNLKGGLTSYLAVDHCHTTGKVRGLLCFKCNTALAQVESRLDKVAAYLEGVA